jgi:hypothetical protein
MGQKSVDLEPWDESYFTGIMKSSTFSLDSSVMCILLVLCIFLLNVCRITNIKDVRAVSIKCDQG